MELQLSSHIDDTEQKHSPMTERRCPKDKHSLQKTQFKVKYRCRGCDTWVKEAYKCDHDGYALCEACYNAPMDTIENAEYYMMGSDNIITGSYSIPDIVQKYENQDITGTVWFKKNVEDSKWFDISLGNISYNCDDYAHNQLLIDSLEEATISTIAGIEGPDCETIEIDIDIYNIPIVLKWDTSSNSTQLGRILMWILITSVFIVQFGSILAGVISIARSNGNELRKTDETSFVCMALFGVFVLITFITYLLLDIINVFRVVDVYLRYNTMDRSVFTAFVISAFFKGLTYVVAGVTGLIVIWNAESSFDLFANLLALTFILELDNWMGHLYVALTNLDKDAFVVTICTTSTFYKWVFLSYWIAVLFFGGFFALFLYVFADPDV